MGGRKFDSIIFNHILVKFTYQLIELILVELVEFIYQLIELN